FYFHLSARLSVLLSFPTRRSSDLAAHFHCFLHFLLHFHYCFLLRSLCFLLLRSLRFLLLVLLPVLVLIQVLVLHIVLAVLALVRSEEHTSELQSRFDLVCRLLLER